MSNRRQKTTTATTTTIITKLEEGEVHWEQVWTKRSTVKGDTDPPVDHLVGLVVKVSASRAEEPGFESRWRRDFSGSSHTSDLNTGIPVATLPGAWRSRVSAGTGRPGVSIL